MLGLLPLGINAADIFSASNIFLIAIALIWMFFASIQDLRKREVENWWNFSLILFVLAYRGFDSIISWDGSSILWGFIGLGAGFLLANLFYYGRMFAGGDAKLLMALGAVLPLTSSWESNLIILGVFLFLFIVVGSVYGAGYSVTLMAIHFKKFRKEYLRIIKQYNRMLMYFEVLALFAGVIMFVFNIYLGTMLVILFMIAPILLIYAKAVENSCLICATRTSDLTIGDWLAERIKIGKKTILPNWEGLDEKELKLIQTKYRGKVMVKAGIPFVPVFFISFAVLILLIYFDILI